ncbi:MAG: DNA polymerase I, partial [Planctomycetota bacterium]
PPLTTADGQQVQAAYAVLNLLARLTREEAPTHWAVVFDPPTPTFRHAAFPDYKANRQAMPEELRAQLPWIHEIFAGFRVPLLQVDGFEADDVVCTLARHAEAAGLEVRLISKDKDLEQLLSPLVKIWDPKDGALFGPQELFAKKGITPDRVIEYLALIGDASDNVPGVAGIGPKTALKVLAAVSDLDRIFDSAGPLDVPAAALEKIRAQAAQLRLSRELVTLRVDAPVPTELGDYQRADPDPERLRPVLERLGFQKFLKELPATTTAAADSASYHRVKQPSDLERAVERCRARGTFGVAACTDTSDPQRLLGLAIAWDEGQAVFVPLPPGAGSPVIPPPLRALLEDPAVAMIAHDFKPVARALLGCGVYRPHLGGDPMLAAYLLQPLRRSYGIAALTSETLHLHLADAPTTDRPQQLDLGFEPTPPADAAADTKWHTIAERADLSFRLEAKLAPEIDAERLTRVYRELELPLVRVLAAMENEGIRLDPTRLSRLESEVIQEVESLELQIHRAAGSDFNINSPKQLEVVLFDQLGLPSLRKTKTGRSTSAEILEELAVRFPEQTVLALVLEYRTLTKLLGTYIQALPRVIRPSTGRLHTDYSQTAAATGRLASSDPNLQNIPVKSALGRRIRRAFLPNREGDVFLSADYSQIELRILAHLCDDPGLTAAMRSGEDIHRAVAARIRGKSPADITREERNAAKAVTFGVLYGMGAFGLARDLRIERSEAQAFIDAFFGSFPGVRNFVESTIERARKDREVRTIFGRRRPLPDIDSRTPHRRQQAERFAVNSVVQGSAADLIKKAMVDLDTDFRARGSAARMILQIHDELLFELPPHEVEREEARIRTLMEHVLELSVPLSVNISVGEDWYEASK